MEKIMTFQLTDEEFQKVKRAAGNLRMRVESIPEIQFRQTLGALAERKGLTEEEYRGQVSAESLLVFCGLEDKKLDKLLAALKKNNVSVDYKAVLTPTNRNWNVLRLYAEMKLEKQSYEE